MRQGIFPNTIIGKQSATPPDVERTSSSIKGSHSVPDAQLSSGGTEQLELHHRIHRFLNLGHHEM